MSEGFRRRVILIIMKIRTNDGEMNVTGQNQGTYNTVAGSLGLAAFLGMGANNGGCGNNGGLLGGLFGGNNNNCCGCPVTEKELRYASALAACQSHSDALATAREEDAKIFNEARRSDEKIAGVVKEVTDGLLKVGNAVSQHEVKLGCIEERLNWMQKEDERNLKEAKDYAANLVQQEAQIRVLGDSNLQAWTEKMLCRKIDGKLVIPGDDVCYNQCKPVLQTCGCNSEQNPYYVTEVKPTK